MKPPCPPKGGPRRSEEPGLSAPDGRALEDESPSDRGPKPGPPGPRGPRPPKATPGSNSPPLGFFWFAVNAVVTKTLLPQTTGCDQPAPGISTFQRMFWLVLHCVARLALTTMPLPSGPRHPGQSLPIARLEENRIPRNGIHESFRRWCAGEPATLWLLLTARPATKSVCMDNTKA